MRNEWRTKVTTELRRRNTIVTKLLEDIQECERRASAVGLSATAIALDNAKSAARWELAGNPILAGMAGRGERPKDRRFRRPRGEVG